MVKTRKHWENTRRADPRYPCLAVVVGTIMSMFRGRPSAQQTEEDLLRDMHLLEQGRLGTAAATVSRATSAATSASPAATRTNGDLDSADGVQADLKVVERQPVTCMAPRPAQNAPFPEVFKASLSSAAGPTSGPGRRSLFAQMMKKRSSKGQAADPEKANHRKRVTEWEAPSTILSQSRILSQEEKKAIHEENLERIRTMSTTEVSAFVESLSNETVTLIKEIQEKKLRASANQERQGSSSLAESRAIGESEKMEWMSDLPSVDENRRSGFSARFNFHGDLLDYAESVPVSQGLHHHGEEQERAGYTVAELLLLSRSANLQQRVIAFETLAKVIQKYKSGMFDSCFEQNLLKELLEGDILVSLRVSLDESVETLREATLFCLRQLLDNQYDEMALDVKYFAGVDYHVQPGLPTSVVTDKEASAEFTHEKEQLKDAEVTKLDVILGLLRTDLLQRMSYIMGTLHPTDSMISNMVCILIRMARHSLQTAATIYHHGNVMSTLYHVISDASEKSNMTVVTACLKLFRILCARSKTFGKGIVDGAQLRLLLPKYLTMEYGKLSATLEAFRVWDTFMRCGMLTHIHDDILPLIFKLLVAVHAQLAGSNDESGGEEERGLCNTDVAAGLFKALEGLLRNSVQGTGDVRWTQFRDIHDLLVDIASMACRHVGSFKDPAFARQSRLLVTNLSVLEASVALMAKEEEVTKVMDKTAALYTHIVETFVTSKAFISLLSSCEARSGLLSPLEDGRRRDPQNLPSCGSVAKDGQLSLGAADESVFGILHATTRLVATLVDLNKALSLLRVRQVFRSDLISSYVSSVAGLESIFHFSHNWFDKDETGFLTNVVLIRGCVTDDWALANAVFALVQETQENCAQLIFSAMFDDLAVASVTEQVADLLNHATTSNKALLKAALDDLKNIKDFYARVIRIETSGLPLTAKMGGQALLPRDWRYLPLISLYNECQQGPEVASGKTIVKDDIVFCLQWALIDLFLTQSMSTAEVALHYSRLSIVFLASESYFLEKDVSKYLSACYETLLVKSCGSLSLQVPIPGIDSIPDFYRLLLDQFNAVSYNHPLFTFVVLLPTAQNVDLRTIFWLDNADNLGTIRLAEDILPTCCPIKCFVPDEEGPDVIKTYLHVVISGTLKKELNPLLFNIAAANIRQAYHGKHFSLVSPMKSALVDSGINLE